MQRRSKGLDTLKTAYTAIGAVLVALNGSGVRVACGAVLVHARWSVAPAHCVAAVSDPHLAALLPYWRLRYGDHRESGIKRSVLHALFNGDRLDNNIGLFEHTKLFLLYYYLPSKAFKLDEATLLMNADDIALVSWVQPQNLTDNCLKNKNGSSCHRVRPVSPVPCAQIMAAVMGARPRDSEFCVTRAASAPAHSSEHGAALVMSSEIVGIFSWGDKQGRGTPFVVLNLLHYGDWLEDVTSLRA